MDQYTLSASKSRRVFLPMSKLIPSLTRSSLSFRTRPLRYDAIEYEFFESASCEVELSCSNVAKQTHQARLNLV